MSKSGLLDNNNIRPIIPGEFDIINVLDQEMGDIVGYFHEDELDDMKDDIQNCARIVKETREEDHEEEQL